MSFLTLLTVASGNAHAGSSNVRFVLSNYNSLLPESNYDILHAGMFLEVLDVENSFKKSRDVKKAITKL